MAVNVSVFDLVNFPNNPKTVTVDLTELVPFGNSGEDTWVFSSITTATASGGAQIQRLYISDIKFGWAKSSGLKSGPYTVNSGKRHLKVAIDEAIGNAVEVTLDTSTLSIGGNALAKDLQTKISNTAKTGGAKAGNLSYLNATVTYSDGVFQIISGTAKKNYTGSGRSSVLVADGTTTTGLAAELGFDIPFTSQELAATPPSVTSLASGYTAGGSQLTVSDSGLIVGGDCVVVRDGTNTEFRGIESGVGSTVTLSSGLDNSYSAGAMVEVLKIQDPSGQPPPAFTNIDDVIKFSIASIANQIDFSL